MNSTVTSLASSSSLNFYLSRHPKSCKGHINYGTAGFRTKATELYSVVFRVGLLAALRSKAKKGSAVGVMITASHNPEEDNGIKIIDPLGEMLEQSWEVLATDVANVEDELLEDEILEIVNAERISISSPALVFVARDTRASSFDLSQAAIDGVKALNGDIVDYDLLTTPQLHYMVRCHNSSGAYGEPNENGYYKKLSDAFHKLNSCPVKGEYKDSVIVDCANGIGALQMKKMSEHIKSVLSIELINNGDGKLNHLCGSDHVKVNQKPPEGEIKDDQKYASFDGDADRIVYFCQNKSSFQLLDGDKILVLITVYLQKLLQENGLLKDLNMSIVQTAYANGNSTYYIEEKLGLKVTCVPTGVKHLHHEAQKADIGVYFEANGHGTVLFNDKAITAFEESCEDGNIAGEQLSNLTRLINQTTGDAISDLLVVETALRNLGWSIDNWNELYEDLPNRLKKVNVKDRTMISTTDAERKCVNPIGLQDAIDDLVKKYGSKSRSFVRPSGTEDAVRIYAESSTQEKAESLAEEVAAAVLKFAAAS